MDKIGRLEVEAALRDLMAEKGRQFVYRPPGGGKCVYWDRQNQEPSCGVGWVLYHRFGWTADEVAALDPVADSGHVASVSAAGLYTPERGGRFTMSAAYALSRFQSSQDMGTPYWKAFECAVGKVELL